MTTDNTGSDAENMTVLKSAVDPIRDKLVDALTPGFQVEFDPDEAELVGAFVEDALSEQDAVASVDDLMEIDGVLDQTLSDDGASSADMA